MRVWVAGGLMALYMALYAIILIRMATLFIPDQNERIGAMIRLETYRSLVFTGYLISNAYMCLTAKYGFEKELLATGLFNVALITVLRTLHNFSILVMPTQLTLLFIIGITIAFLMIVLINGRKYELFKDNGE